MRGDLPSISSAVLCSPLGLAALHSHHQQHQGLNPPHIHTHNSVWVWSSIQTNTHINSFSFSSLSLTDSQQSGFTYPFSPSHTQTHYWIGRQPFPLSNLSCGIQMQSDATNWQKVNKSCQRLWFCCVIRSLTGQRPSPPPSPALGSMDQIVWTRGQRTHHHISLEGSSIAMQKKSVKLHKTMLNLKLS